MPNASDTTRDIFLIGLHNAHALESEAISLMSRQIERLENYPEMSQRLQQHLQETEIQLQRLDEILNSLGDSASTLKDTTSKIMANVSAIGHSLAGDEILKNTFANYAFENFEAASYKSLITMAEAGGFQKAIPALKETLEEELAMAAWIDAHIADTTNRFLTLKQGGEQAKR
ncbi:ferritin-like metal-binding protein YciE [Rhodoligotrophos appendicifer]|uniref:ferritin-like domain-containing protein n=1 Tax=Rhodoligotrophos appendicifer TaxID=987056 RepID=UPI001186E079|nr:ferritin-like domain-containing protein [Rhodoligotrophos appendicifer]